MYSAEYTVYSAEFAVYSVKSMQGQRGWLRDAWAGGTG